MQPTEYLQGLMSTYEAIHRLINEGGSMAERAKIAAPVIAKMDEIFAHNGYHVSHGVLVPPGMRHNLETGALEAIPGWGEAVAPEPKPDPVVVAQSQEAVKPAPRPKPASKAREPELSR